jgi:hypothetical protein
MKKQINACSRARFIHTAFFLAPLLALSVIPFGLGEQQIAGPARKENRIGDPCTPGWSLGLNMPVPLVRAVGVYFPADGNFYTVGGRTSDATGSDFQHVLQYNPSSNSWTQMASTLPDNQVSNMACGVLTGSLTPLIYCVGGSAAGATTATARVFTYDPVTDTPSLLGSDDWPGDAAGTTLPGGFAVVNNKFYTLGGFNINVASTNQIFQFDPSAPAETRWTQMVNAPEGVMYAPTCTIGFIIYLAGASDYQGSTVVDTTNSFSFDPVTDTIGSIPAIPRATGETRALTFSGNMWVMGGGRTPPNPSNEADICCWTTGQPFMTARRNFPTDTDGTTTIWLAGGYASDGVTPLSSMEIFCNAGPTPTPTPTPSATPTATPTPTPTPTSPPCSVSTAGCGLTISGPPPNVFDANMSEPVDPVTVDASDLTVNGIPADSASIMNGNMTIEFTFITSPVTPGLNTSHIAAGAFDCEFGGPVAEFNCPFRYNPPRSSPSPRPHPTPRPRP